jgi:murein DD-endopeptidase MepM/ murein hydrolase activator NlpD
MYDYKFRQDELSFNKRRRRGGKLVASGAGLLLIGGIVYALSQLALDWNSSETDKGADSDVIPLSLPPHSESPQGSRPARQEPVPPDTRSTSEALAQAMETLADGVEIASVSTEPKQPDAAFPDVADPPEKSPQDEPDVFHEDVDGFWVDYVVQPGDSLAKIFRDHDLSPQLLQIVLRSSKQRRRLGNIRPGDKLHIRLDADRSFSELSLQLDALRSIRVAATANGGVSGSVVRKETDTEITAASGTIESTLFSSAKKARIPDAVTAKLAAIFGWDIDFALEIRAGDQFSVVYEALLADGNQVGSGDVLAAKFVNQGKTYRAVRYRDSGGKVDYYSPDGKPLRKLFFRTPVDFTRISSRFSKRRWHPVLKRWRAHQGVDYAAPTGTPVKATGDGTVTYKGWKKGYGRVVYLKHGRTYQTVYGHLSGFAKGIRKGRSVGQGQVIGFVGQTGMATGPHLHYEFHVDGVQRDPLTVKAPIADPLPKKERRRFDEAAEPLLARLEASAKDTLVAEAR